MITVDQLNARGVGFLPEYIGVEFTDVAEGRVNCRLRLRPEHMAPNGYLHAATVIAVADTACGYGTVAFKPEAATNFTTIELKSNFVGTARRGAISCEAALVHGGRTTQIWDATVRDEESGRTIAVFRCTQLLIY
jgi:1,4-dihydroxy-2-naphthoyl-CoA hydrolase